MSHALVEGERFVTAWIDIAELPGGMMVCNGEKFGPVPAMTGCSITTSSTVVDEWKAKGRPVIEIQLRDEQRTGGSRDGM